MGVGGYGHSRRLGAVRVGSGAGRVVRQWWRNKTGVELQPMKPANPKIGVWTCEQGGTAEVFQTVKRGRHFYTKCECCGLNQGTGAGRQQRIFNEAKFIDRAAIAIPSGVTVGGGNVIDQPAKGQERIALDFDPTEPAPQSEAESEPTKAGAGFKRFLPGVLFIAAAGVGLWMN